LGILGATTAHGAVSALLWISLSIGGLSAASAIGWSIPSLISPRSSVGSVGGIINFSNQASGIAAAIVTGYLVDHLHSFAWAFGVSTIYLAIGVLSYLVLLGRIEPMNPGLTKPEPARS
jgi:MFS family permease